MRASLEVAVVSVEGKSEWNKTLRQPLIIANYVELEKINIVDDLDAEGGGCRGGGGGLERTICSLNITLIV